MSNPKTVDWASIEAAYRGGTEAILSIANRHDITEAAIRKMATKRGWVRDPEGLKREKVKALVNASSHEGTTIEEVMESEAKEDARDMNLALQAARLALQVSALGLKDMKDSGNRDAKNTKIWSECVAINTNTIRRIRGLDDKPTTPTFNVTGFRVVPE